ncbi:MAG TPA: inositol monophosphatase family protein [Bacteroidota bacterium]|nr:inositol monophosphatase family protein [Bacteroidota bacterium]
MNYASRLALAIDAAREAGSYLAANLGKVRTITDKDGLGKNVVTEIDRNSEEMILGAIRKNFPGDEILAEEGGKGADPGSGYRWIVDPLDGTTNYTHGFPVFCVSIGIEHEGKVVAGVIYDPNLAELFTAGLGNGARMNGSPIRVSAIDAMSRSLLVTGFPYNIDENPDKTIERFIGALMKAQAVRRMGSAAIDLAYVACGRYEGFWEVGLHPWDVAAGALLVTEAGGMVTDFSGRPCSIYAKDIAASNSVVHAQLLDCIRVS